MLPTLQIATQAWPGVKNLAIAQGMGAQGIVGSICAAQVSDDTQADYGYEPSVAAIVQALGARLAQ
jgi:hypothetical protein